MSSCARVCATAQLPSVAPQPGVPMPLAEPTLQTSLWALAAVATALACHINWLLYILATDTKARHSGSCLAPAPARACLGARGSSARGGRPRANALAPCA